MILNGPLFAFAPYLTFTILTTTPNSLMARYHHRMPVILPEPLEGEWLTPSSLQMPPPFPADVMAAHAVSKVVNSPSKNSVELVAEA